jgi:hypothetical protein
VPLALLAALAAAAPAPPDALLFVGNSYTATQDVDALTASLRASLPGQPPTTGAALTDDGYRWVDHVARAAEPGGWREALVDPGYDATVVVFQEQSQIPGFSQDDPEWLASRDALLTLDGYAAALGAETVIELTWGRRDGDAQNPDRYPDFSTMQALLLDGALAYAAALPRPASVAPVGLAFQRIHDTYGGDDPAFVGLYAADGSHPSALGGYLAAAVVTATLTGLPTAGADPARLTADDAAWLQSVADATVVDDPFGRVPYAWAVPWSAWTGPIAGAPTRPTVGLLAPFDEPGPIAVGGAAPGRLWVAASGALGAVTVDADGELVVASGELALGSLRGVGALQLRPGAALRLGDGAVDVGSATLAGAVLLEGCGTLRPVVADVLSASALGGDWRVEETADGRFALVGEGPACATDAGPAPAPCGCATPPRPPAAAVGLAAWWLGRRRTRR